MKFELVSGTWRETIEAVNIKEAMKLADEEISCNQESMSIYEEGECVASRKWWGSLDGIEDCETPIQYGQFGYYSDWE